MPEHFWWGGMWIFPMIFFVIMVFIMVMVFYFIFGREGFRPPWHSHRRYYGERGDSETPLDILKKRYAKGEISKDEFEQMKKDLLS